MPRKKVLTLDELLEEGLISKGSDEKFVIRRIPFGLPELDRAIGGGVPRNRITLVTGDYSSGKTFLEQLLVKSALDRGLQVAYVDTERSYDPIWWQQVGLDVDKILVAQPPHGEAAINVVVALAKQGMDVIGLDSLAGLVPEEIVVEGAEQKFIASQARVVNRLFQKVIAVDHKAAVVCTNQLRSHLGPGPIDTMPGGWGQLFYGHLILRVYREGWIEEKGEKVGFNMKVVCRKSKVGAPFRECSLPFYFRGEIDVLALLVDRAIEADLIDQAGVWYSIMGGQKMMGRNTVIEALRQDEDLKSRIEAALGESKYGN